jgi:urease accessory protein
MTDSLLLLRLMQDADSLFPSGAVSFSWGLETLCDDKIVCNEHDVQEFVLAQLSHRWRQFERPVVIASARASQELRVLVEIDQLVDARTLCAEFRSGSRRSGNGMLAAHVRLGTHGARDYKALVQQRDGIGHLAPMQGFLWSRRGIPPEEAALMSAHTLCIGLLSAAVRLSVIGHIGAQRILRAVHDRIVALVAAPLIELDEIRSFMPQTEIAGMRHETAHVRLFAN